MGLPRAAQFQNKTYLRPGDSGGPAAWVRQRIEEHIFTKQPYSPDQAFELKKQSARPDVTADPTSQQASCHERPNI